MKNIFLTLLTTLCLILLGANTYAANPDQTYKLANATHTNNVYEWPQSSADVKAQNCSTMVEVPAGSSGKIAFWCNSASSDRFLYLVVNGNNDESRPIAKLNKAYSEIDYTAADITTISGVSYLLFTSPDDYKYRQIKLTVLSTGGGSQSGGGQTTTYTITYNNNGHGTTPPQVTGATALPNPLPTMSETGWIFGGWFTDQACTLPATAGATISANTTLYALWTQDQQQGGGQGGGQQGGGSTSDSFAGLNYDGENAIPNGYTLSTGSGVPITGSAASGMSAGGYYINLSNGGAATLKNGIPTNRFISFELDADCTVEVDFYSTSTGREFNICDAQGTHLYSLSVTTKNVTHKAKYSFKGINSKKKFYFYGQNNSGLYITRIHFEYSTSLNYIKGNDSTQNILTGNNMKPIVYLCKDPKTPVDFKWIGATGTGVTLSAGTNDTLIVGGAPMCAPGTYQYTISTTNLKGETLQKSGKFSVSTKIDRYTPDSLVEGFTGEAIEDIQFRYYALSADSVTLTWNRVAPAGISGNGANGIYTITGTPTQTGDFPFTISVKSGNNIVGMLRVQNSDLGTNPILYLYKNSFDNAFYQNTKKNYNLIARKAKSTLRETAQYAAYDMIIISEDVDANNEEAMAAAEGQIAKPVLNMKGFTYAADRLGWGDPDNGSIVNTKITVMQPTHPIFNGLNATEGGEIQILDTVISKGLMPVKVEKDQSVCLATAAIRGRDYNSDGEQQTFLHEIPAAQRNGQKYLLFPLAAASSDKLNANGKKLLQNCIDYLKNNTVSPVVLPELQITSFTIGTTAAAINQTDNTIELTVPKGTDLTAVTPVVTVKDSKTHAEPKRWNKDGITVDLSNDYMGLDYIVTDYINVRVYTVYAHVENPEGLEEIYAEGEWINIYDIQGRKIMTTNESLHQLSLDRGMYIVVTTRGSFKILR